MIVLKWKIKLIQMLVTFYSLPSLFLLHCSVDIQYWPPVKPQMHGHMSKIWKTIILESYVMKHIATQIY